MIPDSLNLYAGLYILIAGGLYVARGAGLLARRASLHSVSTRNLHAFTFLCLGLLFIHYGIFFAGLLPRFPHAIFVHGPFLLALGPLLFHFLQNQAGAQTDARTTLFLHLMPAIVATILLLPFLIQSGSQKLSMLALAGPPARGVREVPAFLRLYAIVIKNDYHLFALSAYILLYVGFAVVRLRFLLLPEKLGTSSYRAALIVVLLTLLAVSLAGMAGLVSQPDLLCAAYVLASSALFLSYILGQRYPELLEGIRSASRSRLQGVTIDAIKSELERLLESERLYCDEDLSLGRLAAHLALAPPQLSELINRCYQCNFNSFVNGYRIAEAQRLLLVERNMSVLDVAMTVGFNSASVFHAAFRKVTGTTPGLYRKNDGKSQ